MQGCELLLNLGKNKVNIRGSKLTAGLCGRVWKGEGDPPSANPAIARGRRGSPLLISSTYMASEACTLSASQYWLGRQAQDTSKGVLPRMCFP